MIRKDGVRVIISCDGCPAVRRDQDGQHAKWRPNPVVWKEAQSIGWTAKPKDKDWDHFCPTCSAA